MLIVEGTRDDYLIGKFHLHAQQAGLMPFGAASSGNPGGRTWDGVALTDIADRKAFDRGR